MQLKTGSHLISLGLLISFAHSAQANQVYRWSDSQGIVHYSQLPPADAENVAKIDPAMPESQLSTQQLQEQLLSGSPLPATAAGVDECNPLIQDERSYRARKIEERYMASKNNCDVIFASLRDADKRKGCYNNVAAERDRQQASLLPANAHCHD